MAKRKKKLADLDALWSDFHKVATKLDKKLSDDDRETQMVGYLISIGRAVTVDIRRIADALEKKK